MIIKEQIEQHFIPFLQTEIKFNLNGRIIKQGKLLIVNQKGPYISFFMIPKTTKTPKSYEVPYPFDITTKDLNTLKNITFSYKIEDLCKNKQSSIEVASGLIPEKTNRFFNKELHIQTENIVENYL